MAWYQEQMTPSKLSLSDLWLFWRKIWDSQSAYIQAKYSRESRSEDWEGWRDDLVVTNVFNSRCKPWVATELILKSTGERIVRFLNDDFPIIPNTMSLFDIYQPLDLFWATAGGGQWTYFEASEASDFGWMFITRKAILLVPTTPGPAP